MRCIDWDDGAVRLIDQTRLPAAAVWLRLSTVDDLVAAIRRLAVRGAPALGAAGALGVALAGHRGEDLGTAAAALRAARPTAVNLGWGVDRALRAAGAAAGPGDRAGRAAAALAEATAIIAEEAANCRAIGTRGADLLVRRLGARPLRLLTHCNTGWLGCVEWGTALGIVRTLHQRGLVRRVYADETRPLLQGTRLTAYELAEMGVEHRVLADSAAASVLARGGADAVLVGADRIAANGDVANKIGTYPLALAAARAGVPFVVAAPESTVDAATPTGADIPIEHRDAAEVTVDAPAENPAFDVTPYDLVTAIVTERRTIQPGTIARTEPTERTQP
ncbi:MAG TPA: S-methyl-5-thioribose-1-phosphate isomerase [Mycobacteriales bacterium]|nr:S-methyl-5-thioribose-1-phosphate isomerase [Mycobacteriales bacterium]